MPAMFNLGTFLINNLQMKRDIIATLYFSAKNKVSMLDKLSLTLTKDDLQNISSSVINGIEILVKDKLIK